MNSKEKAKELFNDYWSFMPITIKDDIYLAKLCACKAVDEIIKQLTPIEEYPNNKDAFYYWEEVKQEIEKL